MGPLIKHKIIIWSETTLENADLDLLAQQAVDGEAYCAKHETQYIMNPAADPDWDGTEFFGIDEDEDEEESR